MPFIPVNPEAFEGTGEYAVIPNGSKVRATIFEIERGQAGPNSKNPGMPQAVYTVKVSEDFEFTHTNEDGSTKQVNAKGREIKYNYIPLDGSVKHGWQLVAFAEAVGWETDPTRGVNVPENLMEVLGTEVTVQLEVTPDQKDPKKKYNKVRRISKAGPAAKAAAKPAWNEL